MPVDASAMPWWGWLLCGGGGGIIALIASRIVDITKNGMLAIAWWLLSMLAGLGGLVSFVVGVVGFTKWVWR
jgi:hypothetical protein